MRDKVNKCTIAVMNQTTWYPDSNEFDQVAMLVLSKRDIAGAKQNWTAEPRAAQQRAAQQGAAQPRTAQQRAVEPRAAQPRAAQPRVACIVKSQEWYAISLLASAHLIVDQH